MREQFNQSEQQHSKQLQSLLQRHGINPTMQRIEIARILLSRFQHLSADQILNSVNKKQPIVSKATVYNTLNLFAEKGLIRQVIVEPNKVFFDSNTTVHYHFYNDDTGELTDLDANQLEIKGIPELPDNTVKSGIDVIIRLRDKHN